MSILNIKKGTQANYNAITSKDANTIYFTTDTKRIYIGDKEYARPTDTVLSTSSENNITNKAVQTALNGKLSLSGGTMTGDILSPAKIRLYGNSAYLSIGQTANATAAMIYSIAGDTDEESQLGIGFSTTTSLKLDQAGNLSLPAGLLAGGTLGTSGQVLKTDGSKVYWAKDNNTTYSAATTSKAGLLSAADKAKLDAITADADAVTFTRSLTTGTKIGAISINGASTDIYCNPNTTYSAGDGLKLTGTVFSIEQGDGITVTEDGVELTASGATAGSYGPTADVTGNNNTTLKVPYITVDKYGRVTAIEERTYTSKNTDNNTTYTASKGLKVASGNDIQHTNAVTAKTAYTGSETEPGFDGTFTVYEPKYDAQGHITGVQAITVNMPAADNVSFERSLTSGTKIGAITINGTKTDIYCQTNTDTNYYQVPDYAAGVKISSSNNASKLASLYVPLATTTAAGAMSTTDKVKLDGIQTGATTVAFTRSLASGTKIGSISINGTSTDIYCQTNTDTNHYQKQKYTTGLQISDGEGINPLWVPVVTDTAPGLLTSALLTKLNGITESADSVSFTRSLTSGTKIGTITINGEATDIYCKSNTNYYQKPDYTEGVKISTSNSASKLADLYVPLVTTTADGAMSVADKTKLDGIAEGATTVSFNRSLASGTKIGAITINGTSTDIYCQTNTDTNYYQVPDYTAGVKISTANNTALKNLYVPIVTTSAAGAMSAADKTKLNGIQAGATAVSFSRSLSSGTKIGAITINGTSTDIYCQTNTDTNYYQKQKYTTGLQISDGVGIDPLWVPNVTSSASGLMTSALLSKLNGIQTGATAVSFSRSLTSGTKIGAITINGTSTDIYAPTDTDKYHTRDYSSGLKISTGTGVSDMYVPTGTTSTLGVVKQHTADDCTSYTSDAGAVTPLAARKAVGMFTTVTKHVASGTALATIKVPDSTSPTSYVETVIHAPTIPTSLKNPYALTFGSKTYDGSAAKTLTASDLGLSSAMKYLGISTTEITSGGTQKPTIDNTAVTPTAGNVVIYGSKEFVWSSNSKWEELGNQGSYKVVQTAVADPAASGTGTTFIATISQDSNGKITATKQTIIDNDTTYTFATGSTNGTISVTPKGGSAQSVAVKGLAAAAYKAVTDSSSASAIGTGTSLVTERDVYYGLPNINGNHTYNSGTSIYAPSAAGTSGQVLRSSGGVPTWGDVVDSSSASALGTGTALVTERDVYYGLASINNARQTSSISVYAPTSGGTAGYALRAAGATSAPTWQEVKDSTSASAIGTGANLVTERDIYYGLPTINNSHTYNSGTTIYAPTAGGTAGYTLIGKGTTTAPAWDATLTVSSSTGININGYMQLKSAVQFVYNDTDKCVDVIFI